MAIPYLDIFQKVGKEQNLDYLLLAAICSRESGFGRYLTPPGPGGTGDSGHGHGLMQIDDRTWGVWLASHDWPSPYTNITKGAQLLVSNMAFFNAPTPVPGLSDGHLVHCYPHAAQVRGVEPGFYTEPRPVLDSQTRLMMAVASYNTGIGNVLVSKAVGVNIDWTTAGGNYSQDVFNRMKELENE